MSRGRKAKSGNITQNWEQIFHKNVGIYLQNIIIELGRSNDFITESGAELLGKIKAEKAKSNKKEKPLPPIKPEEIPFQIPKNWVWCRLGEVIEFAENLNIESKLSKDTLINYVDIDAIDNHKFVIRDSKLQTVSELSSRARRVLKRGFMLYSLVRPYLNNIALIEEDKENYIGSTGFVVFKGIEIENKYLKYVLLTEYIKSLYLSFLSGFNSPSINQEQFILTVIPLPPLSEQNKIVDFLEDFKNNNLKSDGCYFNKAVEQKIINLHKTQLLASENFSLISHQLTLIENLNQAILQEAVQGKLLAKAALKHEKNNETGQQLLERIKAEKAKSFPLRGNKKGATLTPIKPEEIPFEIPENWVWCRLGEITNIQRGSSPRPKGDSKYFSKTKTEYNWISISDISNFCEKNILLRTKEYLTEEGTTQSRYVAIDEFIIAVSGSTTGKCCITGIEGFIYDGLAVAKIIDNGIIPKFLLNYMMCLYSIINNSKTGASFPNINTEYLNNLPIPLPPLSEQKLIVAEIERQLAKTKALKAQIVSNQANTEALLKALLSRAFEVV